MWRDIVYEISPPYYSTSIVYSYNCHVGINRRIFLRFFAPKSFNRKDFRSSPKIARTLNNVVLYITYFRNEFQHRDAICSSEKFLHIDLMVYTALRSQVYYYTLWPLSTFNTVRPDGTNPTVQRYRDFVMRDATYFTAPRNNSRNNRYYAFLMNVVRFVVLRVARLPFRLLCGPVSCSDVTTPTRSLSGVTAEPVHSLVTVCL